VIRVLIADDQGMIRAGFRSLLEDEPDVEVVGEAVDGEDALRKVDAFGPDIVLMDIRMPILDGLGATRRLVELGSPCRIVVITTFDLDEYVFEALRAGASGFLLKDATAEELIAAIHTVAAGEALIDPGVTRRVIDAFAAAPAPTPIQTRELSRLTDREQQVLKLIARGLSNAEIANRLVVSEATAKTHVSNVLSKLSLRDRVQGVVWAYETGLVRAGQTDDS
jgi:DNA-binding NarL/FixJ family response regulator